MINKKFILLIILVFIFITFYVGYSFSDRGMLKFSSPNFRKVNITPQSQSYNPGDTVKIEYPLKFDTEQKIFRPLVGAELIISTQLKNISSAVYSDGEKIKIGEVLHKTKSNMKYRQVKYNLPINRITDQVFKLEGKVPNITNKEVIFSHIVIRKHYFFESNDMFIVSKKGRVK